MSQGSSYRGARPGNEAKDKFVSNLDVQSTFDSGPVRFVILESEDDAFEGQKAHLLHMTYGRRKFTLPLSGFNVEELDVFQNFMNHAINQARPLVVEKDNAAVQAHREGKKVDARLYREVPIFTTREPNGLKYHSGVPGRLAGILGEFGSDGSGDTDGDRDSSEGVLDGGTPELEATDDATKDSSTS